MSLEVVGTFSVSRLQILDESGNVDKKLEPKLSDQELLKLYHYMLLSRMADDRMIKLQRQGRLGTCGNSIGQEAVTCGAALAMTEKNWLVPSYRELGACLMHGVPLSSMFFYWNGHEVGNKLPPKVRALPIAVIVGSQTLHAVGIAYAMKQLGDHNSAAVTFFGEGASSQGDVHEAMNFASTWKAPVVFICQNNQYAISFPRSMQTNSRTIAQKAVAYDMPGIQVDGNDPLAVYVATKEALTRAHDGLGPTLIEAETYRLMMHTTADDPTKYRSNEEVEKWWKKEPMIRFRAYLQQKGLWTETFQKQKEDEISAIIDAAITEYESYHDVKPDEPFDHIYATSNPIIESQRAEFLSELRKEHERERERGSDTKRVKEI